MITVTHKIDVDGCHYVTTHISDFRDYGHRANQYAIGWCKPNYPVPAIPLKIIHGGITVRWLSIVNPVTKRIARFWHPDL